MIKLTYIFHSSFALETDRCILIFDYWMDPAGIVQRFISGSQGKQVYVFASHFHEDHFTQDIFQWRRDYPQTKFTYILSKDILRHRRAQTPDADVWMTKGSTWQDTNIHVTAMGSNDSGVCWIVETEGQRIFHAGDLCNWYARFLAAKDTPWFICSKKFGLINPVAEEKHFLGELKDIRKVTDSFDLVMFPVDGRIGNGYTLGGRQFIERFHVGMFVPMHFVMSGFHSAWRMMPYCTQKGIPFWCIRCNGDIMAIANNLCIRKSSTEDIPRLQEIFAHARAFMKETDNPHQWTAAYPSHELLQQDIDSGDSYAVTKDGRIVATFVLRAGTDPTYDVIYDGKWLNDEPYATIHRVASSGEIRGVLHLAMQFATSMYNNIRIDTHADNHVMQRAIEKEGFCYCGIIHCWNGSERVAFQFSKQKA